VSLVLGVVVGCALFVVVDGVVILGGGLGAEESGVWVAATAIAAGMVAVVRVAVRPMRWPLSPVRVPAAALVVAGGVLLLLSAVIEHDDGISFLTVTALGVLGPIVTVALAWLAIAAKETSARLWRSTAAVTFAVLGMVAVVPALTDGNSLPAFVAGVAGDALVVAGIALAARQPLPSAAAVQSMRPMGVTRWLRAHPWAMAVGLALGALLLGLVNEAGLNDGQRLWYNSDLGSPELSRHQADGTLTASIVALLGAAFSWRHGRLGAYAAGIAAGAAALFATAGVVILGGRISDEDTGPAWAGSLGLAGLMLVLVLAGTGPRRSSSYRPDRAASVVLAAGFVLLLVFQVVSEESGPTAMAYTRGLALLLPVIPSALVLLVSTTAGDRVVVGAAGSYLLLFVAASLYPIFANIAATYFAAMLCGHLALFAGLLLAIRGVRHSGRAATSVS
jgi:hypothetical protein